MTIAKLGSGARFAALTKKLSGKGIKNPAALAASIGVKKYGQAKMTKMAVKGKMDESKKHEMKKGDTKADLKEKKTAKRK